MAHSLFRSQPITIEAAISTGGKQIGGYRLIWHSNEDWADRVDLKDQTSLTIAKGDRQYHKRNAPIDHQWVYLVRTAFEPQIIWRGGAEWKIARSFKSKIEGTPVECAEFEGKPKDRLTACISSSTRDLLSLTSHRIQYSDYADFRGTRYPKRLKVRDSNDDNTAELTIEIGRLGVNGKVPEPEQGMRESPNCEPSALKGGYLKSKVVPDYPAPARMGRIQGAVNVDVEIRTDGTVAVKSATGHPMLADAAKSAVSGWKYEPFSCNGTPIAWSTEITVNFTLATF